MKRILTVTAAFMLVVSLLSPAVFADRGGSGGGRGPAPQAQGPSGVAEPERDQQQDRSGDQVQLRDRGQDCGDCSPQERAQEAKEETGEARERARTEPAANDVVASGAGPEGGDEVPQPGIGNRPETPPGQAVSTAARSRVSNEGETTENTHRVRMQIQVAQGEDTDGADDADDPNDQDVEDVDAASNNLAQRIWAWQRALMNSAERLPRVNNGAKPFMMVGEPVFDEGGTLSGIEVWKGNRLVRDQLYADASSTISITASSEIRLVSPDGVTVCDLTTGPDCLTTFFEENPDAYVSVWGHVEVVDDGIDDNGSDQVFVAYRITVTAPAMDCVDCESDDAQVDDETDDGPANDDSDGDDGEDD